MKDTPYFLLKNHPLKYFASIYKHPASERSLNRHRYHTIRKFFSIQRRIIDKVLEKEKKMLICLFIKKFNKLHFLSEHFFVLRRALMMMLLYKAKQNHGLSVIS